MSSIIGTADCVQYSTVIINYKSYQNKMIPGDWMTWGGRGSHYCLVTLINSTQATTLTTELTSVQSVML